MAAAAAASPVGSTGLQRPQLSRYESQKRRDWRAFLQYLKEHQPPLDLSRCSGAHVLEFLRHLDQFGKTKVHTTTCPYFGRPCPPQPCPCPLRQAWGSLDALIGRLRAAFDEENNNTGFPHLEPNPFGARAVRLYLREVRNVQAKARGIAYKKKNKKKNANIITKDADNNSNTSPPSIVPVTKETAPPLEVGICPKDINVLGIKLVWSSEYGEW